MDFPPEYWHMVTLTSSGRRKVRENKDALNGLQEKSMLQVGRQFKDGELTKRELQTYFLKASLADTDLAQKLRLCLRCWLSHQISHACDNLATRFGDRYGFTASDLWPFVLDDCGSLNPDYQSFAERILKWYDPTKISLGAWAHRIINSDSEINRFLLDKGLYRVSDWAILNDTPTDRLIRIFPFLGEVPLQKKVNLLEAYHKVYRYDRIRQQQKIGQTRRCSEPTPQQLRKIGGGAAPNVVLEKLHELAGELRKHRIEVRTRMPIRHSLDTLEDLEYQLPTDKDAISDLPQDEFLQRYRTYFLNSLGKTIKSVTLSYVDTYQSRKSSKGKGQLFLTGLRLFYCQKLSMKAIAQELGLNSQVQVTRLLQLKQYRAKIQKAWSYDLKAYVKDEALQHINQKKLEEISDLIEGLITEETESVISEAAAEAQSPIHRNHKSLFAHCLCTELTSAIKFTSLQLTGLAGGRVGRERYHSLPPASPNGENSLEFKPRFECLPKKS